MDFANARYFGGSLASLLSISRASQGTDLLPSSASGLAYNTFANNVLRITPGLGLLIEEARTNVLLNSTAPVTQTSASLATGTYTLWCNGAGSVTPSGGTATITGAAAAANGAPNTFVVTAAGTVVFTKAGALNAFQCELGAFGTSLIVTGGAAATRAADKVGLTGVALAVMQGAQVSCLLQAQSEISVSSGDKVLLGGGTDEQNSIATFGGQPRQGGLVTLNNFLVFNLGPALTFASKFRLVAALGPSGRSIIGTGGITASDAFPSWGAGVSQWALGSSGGNIVFSGYFQRLTLWAAQITNGASLLTPQ